MKTFRANKTFIPESQNEKPRLSAEVIIANTDYEIIDTNQAFGIYIRTYDSNILHNGLKQSVYIAPEEIIKHGIVNNKLTFEEVRLYLSEISFASSCVDFNWGWEINHVKGKEWSIPGNENETEGFLINTTFSRPDTNTGAIGIGKGRRMWIESTASKTSVIMTAWVCIELIVKHELMESFVVDGAKILNPHKTLEQLAYPEKLNNINQKEEPSENILSQDELIEKLSTLGTVEDREKAVVENFNKKLRL